MKDSTGKMIVTKMYFLLQQCPNYKH